jgi:hypothetical protein
MSRRTCNGEGDKDGGDDREEEGVHARVAREQNVQTLHLKIQYAQSAPFNWFDWCDRMTGQSVVS